MLSPADVQDLEHLCSEWLSSDLRSALMKRPVADVRPLYAAFRYDDRHRPVVPSHCLNSPAMLLNGCTEVLRDKVGIARVAVDPREKSTQSFRWLLTMLFREGDSPTCFVWIPFSPINSIVPECPDGIKNSAEWDSLLAHLSLSSLLI